MKRKFWLILVVLALLISVLPLSVLAAAPQDLKLNIRNRTGFQVELNLQDPNGNLSFYTVEEGVSLITLTEGVYSYWADLPCGHIAGTWNVNVVKTLFIACTNTMPTTLLTRRPSAGSCDYGFFAVAGDPVPTFFYNPILWALNEQDSFEAFTANFINSFPNSYWGCYDGIAWYYTW